MRVISYSAHNILAVSDIRFDLDGRHLFLVGGKNGQGKSSALTALQMALCGRSGMDYPEIALKEGEDKGWVEVNLSGDEDVQEPTGLKVELFLRRKRSGQVVEEFRITDSAGEEAPEPRTYLKRLCESRGFDPLAFERLDKKAKRTTLQRLLGLDFTAEQKEFKRLYDERTLVNKEASRLNLKLDELPEHKDVTDSVSVAELMEELDQCRATKAANQKVRNSVAILQTELADVEREIADTKKQIAALEAKLLTQESHQVTIEKKLDAATKEVSTLVDPDESAIKAKINEAAEINAKVEQNKERQRVLEEARGKEAESENLTERMKEIEDSKDARLRAAKWPVPGLSLDEEGVLYNGLPFEQASKSQRVLASTKIGMALNPKLKLLVCQDGNDLDEDSMAALEQVLKENEFTMLCEVVTRTAADEDLCAVVIKDGKVTKES